MNSWIIQATDFESGFVFSHSFSKHGLYQLSVLAGRVGAVRLARPRADNRRPSPGEFLPAGRDSVALADQDPWGPGSTILAATGR